MIKSFYEEPIFSGDFKREDLQEIDTLIQKAVAVEQRRRRGGWLLCAGVARLHHQ